MSWLCLVLRWSLFPKELWRLWAACVENIIQIDFYVPIVFKLWLYNVYTHIMIVHNLTEINVYGSILWVFWIKYQNITVKCCKVIVCVLLAENILQINNFRIMSEYMSLVWQQAYLNCHLKLLANIFLMDIGNIMFYIFVLF